MGGRIWVESVPDEGSSFHFTVRLGVQAAPMARRMVLADQMAGLRVLVVDDSANAREIISSMARSFGMELEAATNGADGLQIAEDAQRLGRPFDIVLTDWKMPGMDGIATARQLRARSTKPPAIIMLTAYGRENALASAREQGLALQAVLTKPVTQSALLQAIGQALGRGPVTEPTVGRRQDQSAEARRQLAGARLLLVEDNELNQELAQEILQQAGITVVVAGDGQQALDQLARDGRFDGVLMDCEMPVMDGYTATAHIRANPALAWLPVLAMTANAMVGDRERVIAVGMNDHIAKPLDIDTMFNVIARWVTPAAARTGGTGTGAEVPDSAVNSQAGAASELPDLPGIDAAAGLARALGRTALYVRLLRLFVQSGRVFEAQFRSAWAADDAHSAERLAHTLRGAAANIEATAVSESAGLLEQACQTEPAAVDALLADTLQALQTVTEGLTHALAAIDARLPAPVVAEHPGVAMDRLPPDSPAPELLRRLQADLDAGEGNALQALARIRPLFEGSALAPQLEPIAAAIDDYDFEAAARLVGTLREALGVEA